MTDYGVLLQQVVNGLSLGAMYALLALGFTLVYGILELINFAHFNVFMVASFIGMWALQLLGLSGQTRVLDRSGAGGGARLCVFCDDGGGLASRRRHRAAVAAAVARRARAPRR